jgi:NitT/TauT family transport system permease protein
MTMGLQSRLNGQADARVDGCVGATSAADRRGPVVRRGHGATHRQWVAAGQRVLRIVSPLFLLAFWELLSRTGILDRRFFPPPSEILEAAIVMAQSGQLADSVGASLRRLAIGYFLGALSGTVVGLWLGLSSWSRALVEPWLLLTYPVPKLAIFPLLVLIVGIGEPPIIILLSVTVFYIVVLNAMAGVLEIKPVIMDVGRDCNATFLQSVLTIALPASAPHIFTGLEVALGIAYIVLVAVEFVGARSGLGQVIWSSWQLFDVAPMYVSIMTISLLGYISVLGLRAIGNAVAPWRASRR